MILAPYRTALGTITASPDVRKLALLTGINALGNGLFATVNISFVITLCLISLGQGLCMSSNTALIRRLARENPALTRASLRSLLTIGLSLGAVIAGLILAIGTTPAFQVAIAINIATFLIAGLLLASVRVPEVPGGAPGRPNPVLPDARFTVFSLANGLIGIYMHAMSFAVPLWMVRHHPDLIWVAGALVAVNSLLTAALQVPASSGITSTRVAARRLVIGAAFVAASYLFFVSGWSDQAWVIIIAVLVFLITHTVGEVFYTAGSMELLFRMAPEHLQGQYGAFYGISNGLMASVAPAALGFAIASAHGWGWWALAGLTLVLALIIRKASRGGAE